MALLLAIMNIGILPSADSRISSRMAAREVLFLNPECRNMMVFGLTRDWNYGMDYYCGKELAEWTPGTPLPEWLLTSAKQATEIGRLGNQFQEVSRIGEPFAVFLHISPTAADTSR
jgi:hypothetical protein